MSMEEYYRDRAAEYDQFYEVARRKDALLELEAWLIERVRGRRILEIAAGTGHWTEIAASAAKSVTATDYNPETLAIAAGRRLGPHVSLLAADAYRLPRFAGTFDAGMAMFWWSHVEKRRREEFIACFTGHLQPGSLVLMIDQAYVEGVSGPISRKDEYGNLYTVRRLASGATYEIIKNYPTDEELHDTLIGVCQDIAVMRVGEFWALSARVRARST